MTRRRLVGLCGFIVIATGIAPFVPWRLEAQPVGLAVGAMATVVAVVNFFLSRVRVPLLLAVGRKRDAITYISGFPLVGMLVVPALYLLPPSVPLTLWALATLGLDTGNLIWFTVSIWNDDRIFDR